MTGLEIVIPALISAAAQGGAAYFGGKAQQEAEKRKLLGEGLSGSYQMRRQAEQGNVEKQQSALADLISAYRSTLE